MARYTLELTPSLERTVKQLAMREGVGPTEVIERAIALYKYVSEQKDQDRTIAVLENSGDIAFRLEA
jgi:predicted transcriptional regulator